MLGRCCTLILIYVGPCLQPHGMQCACCAASSTWAAAVRLDLTTVIVHMRDSQNVLCHWHCVLHCQRVVSLCDIQDHGQTLPIVAQLSQPDSTSFKLKHAFGRVVTDESPLLRPNMQAKSSAPMWQQPCWKHAPRCASSQHSSQVQMLLSSCHISI